LGFATVTVFDSGNLLSVAKALDEKYPEKQIIIAGDHDRHLELTHGIIPGRSKAEEAAKAVGGKVLHLVHFLAVLHFVFVLDFSFQFF
jgi:putative DNA primase/helicase